MDSLGEKLKQTREEQNATIDQAARDTMISKRYLVALEEEDFSAFPGETYLIGFLRNYAEYLGLDPNALITLYRNMKLQEQPIPMEELIHGKKRVSPILIGAGAIAVVAVLAVGIYFISQRVKSRAVASEESESMVPPRETAEYLFSAETDTQWFEEDAEITVPLGDRRYALKIVSIDENLTLSVPGGTVKMEISESRFLDLDLDNKNDIKIYFNDIDSIGDRKRVNLQLTKAALLLAEETVEAAAAAGTAPNAAEAPPAAEAPDAEAASADSTAGETEVAGETETEEPPPVETPAERVLEAGSERIVVLREDAPRVFEVQISFRGDCLLRYLLDGELRDQRFFQKSEEFILDNVRNEVMLWISNAGALTAKVENREVRLGRVGQVVTKLIRWQKEESEDSYSLEVVSAF